MKRRLYKEKSANLEEETRVEEPRLYRVVLHRDDFTPMEFVIEMLQKVFLLERQRAADLMMIARLQGMAVLGMFTKDIAATKVEKIKEEAISNEHPLLCSMEEV